MDCIMVELYQRIDMAGCLLPETGAAIHPDTASKFLADVMALAHLHGIRWAGGLSGRFVNRTMSKESEVIAPKLPAGKVDEEDATLRCLDCGSDTGCGCGTVKPIVVNPTARISGEAEVVHTIMHRHGADDGGAGGLLHTHSVNPDQSLGPLSLSRMGGVVKGALACHEHGVGDWAALSDENQPDAETTQHSPLTQPTTEARTTPPIYGLSSGAVSQDVMDRGMKFPSHFHHHIHDDRQQLPEDLLRVEHSHWHVHSEDPHMGDMEGTTYHSARHVSFGDDAEAPSNKALSHLWEARQAASISLDSLLPSTETACGNYKELLPGGCSKPKGHGDNCGDRLLDYGREVASAAHD